MQSRSYIMRALFQKDKQKEFLKRVLQNTNSPSIKELASRLDIKYSTLKNYFNESRKLPNTLLNDLIYISKINPNYTALKENWGQIKGGKRSKRNK